MAITVTANQQDFRVRYDDGSETTATWAAALDANVSWQQDVSIRVRYALAITNGGSWTNINTVKFQYNKNSGGWNQISSASSNCRLTTSSYVADETATTQQISSGTFKAGNVLTNTVSTTNAVGTVNTFEAEVCFQIRSADTTVGDSIQIRCSNSLGTAPGTITNMLTITVVARRRCWITSS